MEARFSDTGLNVSHWIALKVVSDGVVDTAGSLARELDITTGGVTRLVDCLENRGLMVRSRVGNDRRVVHVAVTVEGKRTVRRMQKHVLATWNEVLADFSQQEVKVLLGLLTKLLAAASRVAEAPLDTKQAKR